MKFIKVVLLSLLALLVVAGIAIWLLLNSLDQEQVKQQISSLAREQADIDLRINGDLSWQIFPDIGLSVADIDAATAGEAPLQASLQQLQVGVELRPLLNREVKIRQLTLRGLDTTLDLGKLPGSEAPVEQPGAADSSSPRAGAGATQPLALSLQILSLRDSVIRLQDGATITTVSLNSVDLENANIEGRAFPVSADIAVSSSDPEAQVSARLNGTIAFDQATGAVITDQLELRADFAATLADPDASIKGKLEGTLGLDSLEGKLSLADARLSGDLGGDVVGGKLVPFASSFTLAGNLESGDYNLRGLAFNLAGLTGGGELQLATDPDVAARGDITLAAFDLKQLLESTGQEPVITTNPAALRDLSLSAAIHYGANRLRLDQLQMQLDQSRVSGHVMVTDLENNVVDMQLRIDKINADDYMAPTPAPGVTIAPSATGSAPVPANPVSGPADDLPLFPVETLRELAGTFKFEIGQLQVSDMPLANVEVYIGAKNQFIALKTLTADFYDGKLAASGSLNLKGEQPVMELSPNLSAMNLRPLLTEQADIAWIEGRAGFSGDLKARGNRTSELKRSLDGKARLTTSDIVVQDLALSHKLCNTIALLNGKPLNRQKKTSDQLQDIDTRLVFDKGVISNPDLQTGITGVTLRGQGKIDLPADRVNYKLGARITGDLSGDWPNCTLKQKYQDFEWPLLCRGQLSDDPAGLCNVDEDVVQDFIADRAKKELQQEASKAILKLFTTKEERQQMKADQKNKQPAQ